MSVPIEVSCPKCGSIATYQLNRETDEVAEMLSQYLSLDVYKYMFMSNDAVCANCGMEVFVRLDVIASKPQEGG